MLVKKGEVLVREDKVYEVIVCDDQIFVTAPLTFIPEEECIRANYLKLEAYSNDESINTLAQLNFVKRIESKKWFD